MGRSPGGLSVFIPYIMQYIGVSENCPSKNADWVYSRPLCEKNAIRYNNFKMSGGTSSRVSAMNTFI